MLAPPFWMGFDVLMNHLRAGHSTRTLLAALLASEPPLASIVNVGELQRTTTTRTRLLIAFVLVTTAKNLITTMLNSTS
jgi:hypothetical protein